MRRCGCATNTVAISGTGTTGTTRADRAHQVLAQRRGRAPALLAREPLEIDAALAAVGAHRDRRTEVDAGVAEAVPLALQHQPQVVRGEGERVPQRARSGPTRGASGSSEQQQGAVLEHAVVVDAQRHEHQVVLAVHAEAAQHVVDHPEARLAHAAVARQAALRGTPPAARRPRSPSRCSARARAGRARPWSCAARSRRPWRGSAPTAARCAPIRPPRTTAPPGRRRGSRRGRSPCSSGGSSRTPRLRRARSSPGPPSRRSRGARGTATARSLRPIQ